jgi:hypothetical protein
MAVETVHDVLLNLLHQLGIRARGGGHRVVEIDLSG